MADYSKYESRTANLPCSPSEYYNFITDLRNFGRFIPAETIRQWQADADSCKFSITAMGDVTLRTASKTPFSGVVFSGTVLVTTAFNLHSIITADDLGHARVRLLMEADLSPTMKMFASGLIERFLETLVIEMEKFENWQER